MQLTKAERRERRASRRERAASASSTDPSPAASPVASGLWAQMEARSAGRDRTRSTEQQPARLSEAARAVEALRLGSEDEDDGDTPEPAERPVPASTLLPDALWADVLALTDARTACMAARTCRDLRRVVDGSAHLWDALHARLLGVGVGAAPTQNSPDERRRGGVSRGLGAKALPSSNPARRICRRLELQAATYVEGLPAMASMESPWAQLNVGGADALYSSEGVAVSACGRSLRVWEVASARRLAHWADKGAGNGGNILCVAGRGASAVLGDDTGAVGLVDLESSQIEPRWLRVLDHDGNGADTRGVCAAAMLGSGDGASSAFVVGRRGGGISLLHGGALLPLADAEGAAAEFHLGQAPCGLAALQQQQGCFAAWGHSGVSLWDAEAGARVWCSDDESHEFLARGHIEKEGVRGVLSCRPIAAAARGMQSAIVCARLAGFALWDVRSGRMQGHARASAFCGMSPRWVETDAHGHVVMLPSSRGASVAFFDVRALSCGGGGDARPLGRLDTGGGANPLACLAATQNGVLLAGNGHDGVLAADLASAAARRYRS